MAKAGRQTSKKRPRRPRCIDQRDIPFDPYRLLPKQSVDALWRLHEAFKATPEAETKAKQLEESRRKINRGIAIRDNQMRSPWMEVPKQGLKKKRERGAPIE